ncbi:hypothetical protein AMECASPLE_029235 [Ameca splendens]|uniref:Uncharacterized protein n=1 Tax=Ameca splendens TaxID=208324 RepID=A0ABV1A204_9TELE
MKESNPEPPASASRDSRIEEILEVLLSVFGEALLPPPEAPDSLRCQLVVLLHGLDETLSDDSLPTIRTSPSHAVLKHDVETQRYGLIKTNLCCHDADLQKLDCYATTPSPHPHPTWHSEEYLWP